MTINRGIDSTARIVGSVELGEDVVIEQNTMIYGPCKIGRKTVIERGAVVGYSRIKRPRADIRGETTIGEGVLIGMNAIVYRGCKVDNDSSVFHGTVVRENTDVGRETNIGHYCVIEGYSEIGSCCSIWGQSHITAFSAIEDYVFTGPFLMTTNDPVMNYRRNWINVRFKGPTIRRAARIGAAVTLLPGITVGREAVVGAGSVVTKDIPDFAIAVGTPARIVGEVPKEQLLEHE